MPRGIAENMSTEQISRMKRRAAKIRWKKAKESGWKFSPESRAKMSASAKISQPLRFKNHIYSTERRDSTLYRRWREAVLKRDNYTCQRCGKKPKGRALCVHHHKPWLQSKRARFDVNNGLTVCRSCHLKLEQELHPRRWARIFKEQSIFLELARKPCPAGCTCGKHRR